ncbi:M23 family metallopeptidase [Streptomyces physcomitrii]|uniref:M23 family metallopeptidase n=1 Tax=Streptomyces physcomitrii TaxID=2724184 RepID=UPI0033CC1949
MTKRAMFPGIATPQLRTRAAVLAAGMGAAAALGAGVATAADGNAKDVTAAPGATAASVKEQADAQAKAAKSAKSEKKDSAAKKDAPKKKAAKKKPASWVAPVKKYELSAGFGLGGNMWSSKHSGQDFAVSVGTDVNSVHGGTVVKAGPNGGGDGPAYGNAIVVSHGNGTYTQYAHLSRIDVKVGENVKTGEHIAKSGNTGNSSGPHLHFEVRTSPNYGSAVNPVQFMRGEGLTF